MAIPSTQIAAVIPPTGASANSGVNIVNTHPVPTPGDGDLLVKLEFSGVCHTDIHSIRGDTPMLTDVAGHEGVGTVVSGEKVFM
jgi:propanol-preferring alcohol dehydrogenase